jgi:ATP-dependent Clp protease protease subunit
MLPEYRILQAFGEINSDLVSPLIACIHLINAQNAAGASDSTPIRLFVNSDGGHFEDGFALVDTILNSIVPVHTFCIGRAYSVALPIFLAGHDRSMYRHSSVMFHGVSIDGAGGTAKSLHSTVDDVDKCNSTMKEFVTSRCKIPPAMLKAAIEKNKDLYIYPDDVLRYKMAHRII